MPLTDAVARTAKPSAKPYKLSDEKGLYLLVKPTGSKLWLYKYRIGGKERSLSIGQCPQCESVVPMMCRCAPLHGAS
jgi:hypothetical protein